jgi:hypothetical protein
MTRRCTATQKRWRCVAGDNARLGVCDAAELTLGGQTCALCISAQSFVPRRRVQTGVHGKVELGDCEREQRGVRYRNAQA